MEYRPNVAILLVREDDKILVCERLKVKGAWQFPQGGVDEGETLEEALKLEVLEEISVSPESYDIPEMRGGYRYVYPDSIKKKKRSKGWFDGQEQTYFRCLLHDSKAEIKIDREPREFRAVKWIKPCEFKLSWLPFFKREVYRKVLKDFFDVDLV